jgi:predicted O-methyltransferase YrrM
MKSIVVTGCDSNYFHFVEGLVRSIRQWSQLAGLPVGLLDIGLEDTQRQWLVEQGVDVRPCGWDFEFARRDAWEATKPWFKAYLCRPHLRKHFPGFDVYCWLDADTWVQRPEAVELLLTIAGRGGLAAVPEIDRSYSKFINNPLAWEFEEKVLSHCLGPELVARMRMLPQFNAGVFAMRRDAAHWEYYRHYLQLALERVDPAESLSRFAEQVAFNAAITLHDSTTHRLPSTVNWMSLYSVPAFDVGSGLFVERSPPHQQIGIMHLTTDVGVNPLTIPGVESGETRLAIRTPLTFAGLLDLRMSLPNMRTMIAEKRMQTASDSPPAQQQADYVSPGLERIDAARFFPHRMIGDRATCSWPYLRREVPHHWYVDRRSPKTGFLNVDETHVLYNLALEFRGRRALEIGCWMGWSACHLALAGVVLDVVDPVLANSQVRAAVTESIVAAGVADRVCLIAGESPFAVGEFARSESRRWSLCFIDGNHDGQAPLLDAQVCEPLMEPDAAIVFHDLVSPDVAAGLAYLRDRGWQTRIYQTMQIMGIAWRGAVTPPRHTPDPAVTWTLPEHLAGFQLAEPAEEPANARGAEASP